MKVFMMMTMMMMILDMVTSRRMGKSRALHNLFQDDWPCFPNDALLLSILLQIMMSMMILMM